MGRKKRIYILARGDETLDVGTAEEIAERRGVRKETIQFYATSTYNKRSKNSDKRVLAIPLEDDEEDDLRINKNEFVVNKKTV